MTDLGYDEGLATYYDAMAAEHSDTDRAFYVDLATAADGPVLELAVGTGRIYLDVLAAGVDADGVDAPPAMLSTLRERADERGLDPSVWEGDMRTLDPDRSYDLIYCPFNALQHAYTVDDQQATFEAVYDALAPGGRFVFDVFVPDFDLIEATYGEWQTETLTVDGVEHELRTRTRFVDEPRQIAEVENELRAPDGAIVHENSHRTSLFPYQQVELLARASPFESWSVDGDFDGSELEDGDSVQVWTLERDA
jgi:SAM-dependent methyltransferase